MEGQTQANPFNISGDLARRRRWKIALVSGAMVGTLGLVGWGAAMLWRGSEAGSPQNHPPTGELRARAERVEVPAGRTPRVVEPDGLYVRRTVSRIDVLARHGMMSVSLPAKSSASFTYKYRELENEGPSAAEMTLLTNTQVDSALLKQLGVLDAVILQLRQLDGPPAMVSRIQGQKLEALYGNYERATDAGRDAAREALIEAVGEMGDKFTAVAKARLAAREALLTPGQLAGYLQRKEEMLEADRASRAATRPAASRPARGGRGWGGGMQAPPEPSGPVIP